MGVGKILCPYGLMQMKRHVCLSLSNAAETLPGLSPNLYNHSTSRCEIEGEIVGC